MAAAVTIIVALAGVVLAHRYRGAGEIMILPLWGCGLWYVVARTLEANSPEAIRLAKLVSSIGAIVLAPVAWGNDVTLLAYARGYGWMSDQALGSPSCITLELALVVFLMADAVEWGIRLRQRQHQRQEGRKTGTALNT